MVASSSISDRRKCWRSFLSMRFPYHLSMLSPFGGYAFSWGFHMLAMSRYTSFESFMSSNVGVKVGKYDKTPHS